MATTAVRKTARKTATKLTTVTTVLEADKGKRKRDETRVRTSPSTPEDVRVNAMRVVNTGLQVLSTLVQSGWKAPREDIHRRPTRDPTIAKVAKAVEEAGAALEILRSLSTEDLDVERAASSFVGKLLALEQHDAAITMLRGMHSHIASLANAPVSLRPPYHLLSFPLPSSWDATLTTLTFTALAYALIAETSLLLHSTILLRDLVNTLQDNVTLIDWAQHIRADSVPEKTRDALLTRSYTSLTKICSTLSSYTNTPKAVDLQSIFYFSIYALSCLLYTSPGTVKPSTFWEQVQRACLTYCRASVGTADEVAAALYISKSMHVLVRRIQGLCLRTFMEGTPFFGMCDVWMTLAKQGGDMDALDHISGLMTTLPSRGSTLLPPLEPKSARISAKCSVEVETLTVKVGQLKLHSQEEDNASEGRSSLESLLAEGTQVCAVLMKTTASLENEDPDTVKRTKQMIEILPRYQTLISRLASLCDDGDQNGSRSSIGVSDTPSANDVHRLCKKMERSMERLRRAAIRTLDVEKVDKLNGETGDSITLLLEGITRVFEADLERRRKARRPSTEVIRDSLTSLLDTRFVVARTRLDPRDANTCAPALEQLEQGVATTDAMLTVMNSSDITNFLRCISGAFHNLGGTLYKANSYGCAINFLKRAGDVGLRALKLRVGEDVDGVESGHVAAQEARKDHEKNKEGWKQLEEQLFRRYELLGVCYLKLGDRKLAHEAFLQSVRTFPYTQFPLFFAPDPFSSNTGSLKQLASIVERLTYMATCELFLPPVEVSLRHVLDDALSVRIASDCPSTPVLDDAQSKAAVTGALLSHQLATLDSIVHKEGVRRIMLHILRDLLTVYDSEWTTLRRVGAMLSGLGMIWRNGGTAPEEGASEDSQWEAEAMEKEVLMLLEREVPHTDVGFASLVPEYALSVHLWLSLHSYRRLPAGPEMTGAVATHIEKACVVLANILLGIEKVLGKGSPIVKGTSGATKMKTAKGGAGKKGLSATKSRETRKALLNPVTPQPRKDVCLNSAAVAPTRTLGDKKPNTSINLSSLLGLLQMNIHLLGLLGLIVLKVKLLEILKRICELQNPVPIEAYSTFCIDLAHEYIKLGRPKRAGSIFNRCASLFQGDIHPDEVRLRYLLGKAEVLALGDNTSGSESAYCEAQGLEAVVAIEDKTASTSQRIRARVERLERAALACRVFAAIQYSKDDLVGALCTMLQSLRLWNRAVDAISRLSPSINSSSKITKEDVNPFEAPSSGTPGSEQPITASPARSPLIPVDALSWRLLSSLLSTLLALSQIFFTRGSTRETLYFAQQALDLAEATKASTVAARALTIRCEVLLGQGELKESREALDKAARLLEDFPGVDAADLQRLRGDHGALCEAAMDEWEDHPKESYERARKMLDELEGMLVAIDGGRRRSSVGTTPGAIIVNPGQGMIVPRLLSTILRRHIWLLRHEGGDLFKQLVERLMSLPPSAEIKGEEHAVMGKLTMHSVYEQFQADILLNSLTESALSLPVAVSGERDLLLAPATQDILGALYDAGKLFWADLALTSRRGNVPHVREAAVSLGMIEILQSALGKATSDGPLLATCLLDASSAVTLRREMLEAIRHKCLDQNIVDDLQWPLLNNHSPLRLPSPGSYPERHANIRRPIRVQSASPLSATSDPSEPNMASDDVASYWSALQQRHADLMVCPSTLGSVSSEFAKLPPDWTVIHIVLTPDKSTMLLSRLSSASSPLLFCLPLRGRVDSDEPHLTLDGALGELRDIVRLSDEGARRAVHVRNDDPADRAAWWAERAALDRRLKALLDNIEFCWLGGFKAILGQQNNLPPALLDDLRVRLDKVLSRALSSVDTKKRQPRSTTNPNAPCSNPPLSEPFLNCLASLPPTCKNEELEDILCFVLDLYQLHGVPVDISEIDVDRAVVDLRVAFTEHRTARKKAEKKSNMGGDHHTFLILDRRLQGIPWESIPVLRARSVSRIPSLHFLLDRVDLAMRLKCEGVSQKYDGDTSQQGSLVDRIRVDPRKTYYVLNPSGDLKGTEGRFASWLKQMHSVGWNGITGRAPSEQEVLNALSQKDLVIYFGHGAGEQYVRSHKIRHLQRCAATMLWGCSSGTLKDMGEFERVGMPYHYMLAGCPTLVANLWDVTDRDIDKFTQGVFDKLRLTADEVHRWQADETEGKLSGTSVVAAVAQSRQLCKLKYLTGAAPVVYGIPFYL